ncbi:26S proteasome non-ATPase regulatory subunit 12 [Bactrocera neohumeralis]|uniref:26S proteasome non-ATPase regulatory subunit 12 n=1 Tax=Bactrocera tryoni TaxID=59916 RepID=UPI001A95F9C0|nr:26S proteasome non-ATPase regulatory subunit 12 [Bactrocera tryoni]XP_039971103.1 26S proteasome non-ATPase regulatory subunit 12 [Bactrocera tryoni]XP_050332756.1 26S proteasome non-ATPase regulatory subunit 12 [Bactrocera neohumeralis]XP_050332765.1 26S proteasome non-ATPase regulatory subunit 12 [Bactrocera neohumeralis]
MDNYLFEGGRITKMEVDYSPACDEKIPLAKDMAKKNPEAFHDAIELLLQLEKQTRLGADMVSCSRVLVAICQICFEAQNWNALNEYVSLLARRRSQLKQAVSKMIQECCTYVDKTPDKATKLKLIDTLRSVTEGKIYVEIERARLTKILADIKEADGDIAGAASVMEELQVETYGSMDKREKVELILEQMRLCLLKEDFVSTQIIAKKISIKFFDDPAQHDLKLKFYNLMIRLDRDGSFLKTSRHYQAIAEPARPVAAVPQLTEEEKKKLSEEDKKKREDEIKAAAAAAAALSTVELTPEQEKEQKEKLICAVLYCVLAPYDNEQSDMMAHLSKKKKLEDIPAYREILRLFMSKELINFDTFNADFGSVLAENEMFAESTKHGRKCISELKDRLIEHNIRIIAMYYSRIHLQRMSELLNLPTNRCEEYLSKLANSDTIRVKIDRPVGIIYFTTKKSASDILNNWANDVNQLMSLVNKTCHLINKEECIHSAIGVVVEE